MPTLHVAHGWGEDWRVSQGHDLHTHESIYMCEQRMSFWHQTIELQSVKQKCEEVERMQRRRRSCARSPGDVHGLHEISRAVEGAGGGRSKAPTGQVL